jgi:uracil-DNA glycosylase
VTFPVSIPYDLLRSFRSPGVFNPWCDEDPLDRLGGRSDGCGPKGRLERLQAHFSIKPKLLLLGEAAGYQGCHFSGIPFTNEKLLLAGRIPRVGVTDRLTERPRPWCEPSATVVWGVLHDLGLAEHTVLWNTFAWHPYKSGNLYSNRAPTRTELELGQPVLEAVLDTFSKALVVAVGKVAERTLVSLGRTPGATVRHPSMGGANEFRAGLKALMKPRS